MDRHGTVNNKVIGSKVQALNVIAQFFLKIFWRTRVLFVGPLIPLFRTSGDVSSGFQSQSGFYLIRA